MQDTPDGSYAALEKKGKKQKANLLKELLNGFTNYRIWLLAACYAYSFGVEVCLLQTRHCCSLAFWSCFLALLSGTRLYSSTACWWAWTGKGWLVEWYGYMTVSIHQPACAVLCCLNLLKQVYLVMQQRAFCTAPAETARQI